MPQSTIAADTGNQATITFDQGITASLKVRSIEQPEQNLDQLDASVLTTSGERVFIPNDLTDPIELSCEYIWDTFDTPPALGTNLGTTTVTYPLRTGETTPATRAGSAYVSGIKHPDLRNGEIQVGILKVQFDGSATPVAYTKST